MIEPRYSPLIRPPALDYRLGSQAMTTHVVYTGTRPPESSSDRLSVRHWPLLETSFSELERSDLVPGVRDTSTAVVLYSKNAVRAVKQWPWSEAFVDQVDAWWAVGSKTATFASKQLAVDCRAPSISTFDGLIESLRAAELPEQLLSLTVHGKTRDLTRAIGGRSTQWRDIAVYRTAPVTWHQARRNLLGQEADWVAVTSPRGVRALVDQIDRPALRSVRIAAIGPTTADALTDHGLTSDAIPDDPGGRNLIRAILAAESDDSG
jgi:uroporphyrinogen-III synthase